MRGSVPPKTSELVAVPVASTWMLSAAVPLPFTSNVVLMRLSYSGFASATIWKASPTLFRFRSRTSPRPA